jgi:hypothetical protein
VPDLAAAELLAEAEAHARDLRKRANQAIAAANRAEADAEAIRRSFERVVNVGIVVDEEYPKTPPRLEVVPALAGSDEHYEALFARSDFLQMSRLDVIVHVLRTEKRGMGSAEIHALMLAGGRSDKIERVRNAMYDLHVRGRVVKLARGKWTVPELQDELAVRGTTGAETIRRGKEFIDGFLPDRADVDAHMPDGG